MKKEIASTHFEREANSAMIREHIELLRKRIDAFCYTTMLYDVRDKDVDYVVMNILEDILKGK